jgi:hypothetical protein
MASKALTIRAAIIRRPAREAGCETATTDADTAVRPIKIIITINSFINLISFYCK